MIPLHLTIETILGEVVAKANHYQAVPDGNGGRRIIKDAIIRNYEAEFVRQVQKYKDKRINARFALYADIYYRNSTHDLDNSLKTVLDCLQYAKVITDDRYCVEIHATKHRDPYRPRVCFAIEEFEQMLKL